MNTNILNFRVGDRVKAIGKVTGCSLGGMVGKVVALNQSGWDIGVEFDRKFSNGHTCGSRGKSGYCRWGYFKEFIKIEDEWDT